MRRDYPRTYAYLKQFEPLLAARAAYRRYQGRQPFYSMYNVGPYTLAATKVIWRRMDRMIRAAVVESIDDPHLGTRPLVPQETCVLIACDGSDEAHYLCAVLNSTPVHELVAAHSVAGGKGFGTPSILDYVPLRKFDPADARHPGTGRAEPAAARYGRRGETASGEMSRHRSLGWRNCWSAEARPTQKILWWVFVGLDHTGGDFRKGQRKNNRGSGLAGPLP